MGTPLSNLLALDVESTGLNLKHGCQAFLISITDSEGNSRAWEFDVDPFTRKVKVERKKLLELKKAIQGKRIVFHHGKFDIEALTTIGFYISFPEEEWPSELLPYNLDQAYNNGQAVVAECEGWEDTYPASHIQSSKGTHALKELALMYLDYPETDEEELLAKVKKLSFPAKKLGYKLARKYAGKKPDGTPKTDPEYEADYWLPKAIDPNSTLALKYCTCDTERTILLWIKIYKYLLDDPATARCYRREKNLIPIFYAIEHGGITLSKHSLKFYKKKLSKESIPKRKLAERIAAQRLGWDDFNINSPKQLYELLYFDKKGFRYPIISYTDKENPSTDTGSNDNPGTLIKLKNDYSDKKPEGKDFLENVITSKQFQTGVNYLDNYQRSILTHWDKLRWVMYPTINSNGTDSTRSASYNPNAQNISKKAESPLRNIFSPPEGKVWFAIDYQQLQLRIFAFITKTQKMIEAFRKGYDFHAATGAEIFKIAIDKLTKLQRRIAKNTNFALIFGAGKKKVNKTAGVPYAFDRFNKTFPTVKRFLDNAIKSVRTTGGVVTPFGYPLEVNRNQAYAGGNYLIQGCEGDIVKNAMVMLVHLGLIDFKEYRIVLLVHDELIIECPEDFDEQRIRKIMGVMEYSGTMFDMETPVEAELIDTHWGRGKKQKHLKPILPNAKKCKEIIYGLSA